MTTQEWTDEPHTFLLTMTTPDGRAIAAIDLHYELAIERDPFETDGLFIDVQPAGARVVVDDGTTSAAFYLNADECVRAAHYLLACGKAAVDRHAGLP